jgi:hypothetical protein
MGGDLSEAKNGVVLFYSTLSIIQTKKEKPEFYNSLDHLGPFTPLDHASIMGITSLPVKIMP